MVLHPSFCTWQEPNSKGTSGFKEADSLAAVQILNADFPLEAEICIRDISLFENALNA